jgi:hypothetical protein
MGVFDHPIPPPGKNKFPNSIPSPVVVTLMVVVVASNAVVKLNASEMLFGGLPPVTVMSHVVMSAPGSDVPVAPFVVIVPDTVYPFCSVG